MKNKLLVTSALGITLLFSGATSVEAAGYKDVKSNNLYYTAINELSKKHITTSSSQFKGKNIITKYSATRIVNSGAKNVKLKQKLKLPSKSAGKASLTRAQAVKMLVQGFNINTKSTKSPFTDMSSKSSYYHYVNKAYNAGVLTKGYNTKLNPHQKITREEFAGLTFKAINYNKFKGKSFESTTFKRIDRSKVPKGYKYPKSYKMMVDGLKKNEEYIQYDNKELPFKKVRDVIYNDIYLNTPSGYLIRGWTISSNGNIKMLYSDKPKVAAKKMKLADKKAEGVIKKIIKPNYNDYDKVKAVHDYIAANTVYNFKGLNSNTLVEDDFNIYGTLVKGVAVCDGYARTASYLLDKLGIDNQYVLGNANGGLHAWNKVKIDGKWYNMDITWDDPSHSKNGKYRYTYFLLSDSVMFKDHKEKNLGYHKATSTKYNKK